VRQADTALPPNPQLQRTHSAPLRSPLNRKPLGGRGRWLAVGFGILVSLGCASVASDLSALRKDLSLEIGLPGTVRIGETVELAVTLRDRGAGTIDACLGEGLSYHVFGTNADLGRLLTVNHPRCVRRFRLSSGETLAWQEPIQVGDVGFGPAKFSASVESWLRSAVIGSMAATTRMSRPNFFSLRFKPPERSGDCAAA
jgi:hypothetical protein